MVLLYSYYILGVPDLGVPILVPLLWSYCEPVEPREGEPRHRNKAYEGLLGAVGPC